MNQFDFKGFDQYADFMAKLHREEEKPKPTSAHWRKVMMDVAAMKAIADEELAKAEGGTPPPKYKPKLITPPVVINDELYFDFSKMADAKFFILDSYQPPPIPPPPSEWGYFGHQQHPPGIPKKTSDSGLPNDTGRYILADVGNVAQRHTHGKITWLTTKQNTQRDRPKKGA